MKGLVHFHRIPIYDVWIKICFDKQTFEKYVTEGDVGDCGGYAYWNQDTDVLGLYVEMRDGFVNMPHVAHEAFHLTDYICERQGIEHTFGTGNEAWAYLLGYIVDQVLYYASIDTQCSERYLVNNKR